MKNKRKKEGEKEIRERIDCVTRGTSFFMFS